MDTTLIFTGVLISLFIQLLKTRFNLNGLGTLSVVAGLAVLGSVGYYVLNIYGLVESFLQIMTTAGAFYAFIIKTIKDSNTNTI